MSKSTSQMVILWIVLVLVQVLVLNHICLWNVAIPIVFIYVLLRMPVTLALPWLFTIAFFTGLTVDMFADTYGMNALCCTLLAGVRKPILRLYVARDTELSHPEPSMLSLGTPVYFKYLVTATLFYCIMIFTIEAFTFFFLSLLLARIIASTILSVVIMAGIDALMSMHK